MLRDIAMFLIDHCGASVLLVGHFYVKDAAKDDRRACAALLDLLPSKENVMFLPERYTAAQIKGILATCTAVISSRYHALIAALSQGVPAVALGWSHKYEALLSEVGTPENCIQMEDELAQVYRTVTAVFTTGAEERNMIRERAVRLAATANAQFDDVIRMVGAGGNISQPGMTLPSGATA